MANSISYVPEIASIDPPQVRERMAELVRLLNEADREASWHPALAPLVHRALCLAVECSNDLATMREFGGSEDDQPRALPKEDDHV